MNYKNKIFHGDCISHMQDLIKEGITFNAIITDPPYGILKDKIETNVDMKLFFELAYKLLAKDGYIIFFGKDVSFSYWMTYANEIGFTHKNNVYWDKIISSSIFSAVSKTIECISIFAKHKTNNTLNKVYIPFDKYIINGYNLTLFDTFKRNFSTLQYLVNTAEGNSVLNSIVNNTYKQTGTNKNHQNSSTVMSKDFKRYDRVYTFSKILIRGYKFKEYIRMPSHNLKTRNPNNEEFNIKHPTVKPIELIQYLIQLIYSDI